MSRSALLDGLVFVLLVLAGVFTRIEFRQVPNFKPVAALALFAGFYFAAKRGPTATAASSIRPHVIATAVPLCIMAASDWWIGGYDLRLMALVYAMLTVPALVGPILRRRLLGANDTACDSVSACVWLGLASLASSLAFFLVTNFGCWFLFDHYAKTWTGLLECYTMAVPFFRYTVAGDLFFASLTFGSYILLRFAVQPASDLAAQPNDA